MKDVPDRVSLEHDNDRWVDRVLFPVIRGGFAGGIAVMAIAVWAINFEAFVNAKGQMGLALALLRLVICDAIPLAILLITLAWLAKTSSSESLLRTIVDSLFFICRPSTVTELEDDAGFRLE